MPQFIYFNVYRDGVGELFQIWNYIPKTDTNIMIADALCRMFESEMGDILLPGDHICFNYR